ncbi:hypothetical protein [Streptomyces sp. NPDC058045]|uniref:hypothetical protein n=1 Tax=Streptomyces sp. NPDC058045 TaxID=3346311 RepID=UPI0036E4D42D
MTASTTPDQPAAPRAEQVGYTIGRGYRASTTALTTPIRIVPVPRWPLTIPGRIYSGWRIILTGQKNKATKNSPRGTLTRYAIGAGMSWWGYEWAAATHTLQWAGTSLAAAAVLVGYAKGETPELPAPRPRPTGAAQAPTKDAGRATGEPTDTVPTDTEEKPATAPLLQLCAHLIGPRRGVHLRDIAMALREAGAPDSTGAQEVRSHLTRLGVRVRPSVRAPKGVTLDRLPAGAEEPPVGVAQGVHRDDLEAVIGPLPEPLPDPSPETGPEEQLRPATRP